MAITQNHVINIQPGVSAPLVIHCSQGDTGSVINLTVVNGDEEFDCSSYACSVHGTRSDRGNWGPVTCNVSGSTVSFSLTSDMTAVAGSCLAEASIGTVGTANFALLVENATFENGVTYSNDVSVYQNIFNYVIGEASQLKNELVNRQNTFENTMSAEVAKSIPPLVVDDISSMTNNTRTYILKSNSHIYQYNGSTFIDTGLVYGSSLANVYSTYDFDHLGIYDLNNLTVFGSVYHSSSTHEIYNVPDGESGTAAFMVMNYYQSINRQYQIFFSYDNNKIFTRLCRIIAKGGSVKHVWSQWKELPDNVLSTYTQYDFDHLGIYDLNNLTVFGSVYHSSSSTHEIYNVPDGESGTAAFMVMNYYQSISRQYQIFFSYDNNKIFTRLCRTIAEGGSVKYVWSQWKELPDTSQINEYINEYISEHVDNTVSIIKNSDTHYTISVSNKYLFNFEHTINTNKNSDLWNISNIYSNDLLVVPTGTDILGPIKEQGQNDFMGGVHGNEKITNLFITCDGVEWDESNKTCNEIKIVMVSELFRVSTHEHTFNRYVEITVTNGKITVQSYYKCIADNTTIERATNGGLIAVRNPSLKAVKTTNYFTPVAPEKSPGNDSKYNVSGTLYWTNGSLTVNNLIGHEYSTYSGYIQVFANENPVRTKLYLDTIHTPTPIANGESILGKFEIVLK